PPARSFCSTASLLRDFGWSRVPMSATAFDGPLTNLYTVELAGSWVNAMLFAFEAVLAFRYLARQRRPLMHRLGIALMVFFDLICTMAIDASVLMTFLTFFGKANFRAVTVPTTIIISATYATAAVEQSFLCNLYFVLSRNKILSLIVVLSGLLHFGFSFASAIMLQPTVTGFRDITYKITSIGAILCSVTDILIAGLLGYELNKIRIVSLSSGSRQSSQLLNLARKVLMLSLVSGAVVASTTLLMMILFLKGHIVFNFFFFCQGRIYALTLLINFLSGPRSASANVTVELESVMNGHRHSVGVATPTFARYSYSTPNVKDLPPETPDLESSLAAPQSIPIPLWELASGSAQSLPHQDGGSTSPRLPQHHSATS
ncbi:unnamed protein product, partial [Mycena citricolor]